MGRGFDILLVFLSTALVCSATWGSLPLYKCSDDGKQSNNSCTVEEGGGFTDRSGKRLPSPVNCNLIFQVNDGCDTLYTKLKFAYRGESHEVGNFRIKLISIYFNPMTKVYTVVLPKNYNKTEGGRFEISFTKFFVPESIGYEIEAYPGSSRCSRYSIYKAKLEEDYCVDADEYEKRECYPGIPICKNKKRTTTESTTHAEPTTAPYMEPGESGSNTTLIAGVVVSFVLVIAILGAVVIRKRIYKKSNKERAVILASSGDSTSKFTDVANLIASELKSSNKFEEVFFSGWLQVNTLGGNLEQLIDALTRSTVVILFASPYGKTSYEKFVKQGQLATWKDEFVVGAHSLFRPSNHTAIKSRVASKTSKVYVVYQSDDQLQRSDFLHDDFERHASGCYDLSLPQDNTALYKKLLRRRRRKVTKSLADADQEAGRDESATTRFI